MAVYIALFGSGASVRQQSENEIFEALSLSLTRCGLCYRQVTSVADILQM